MAGLLFPLLWPNLPDPAWIAVLLALAAIAASWRQFGIALLLVGASWCWLHLQDAVRLREGFALPSETQISGRISGIPAVREGLAEFRFTPDAGTSSSLLREPVLLVRWYRSWPRLRMGERWRLQVQLKPARARLNFSGSDPERWYFSQDITALATVRSGERIDEGGSSGRPIRARVRDRLDSLLRAHPARGVMLALTVADRSQLDNAAWKRYRLTGTSHLLAISGMHIGIAAMLGFFLGRMLLALLPGGLGVRWGLRLPWCLGLLLAAWYAGMAGHGTSTLRALIMLALLAFVSLWARHVRPMRVVALALLLVLLCDPLEPLAAGLWLSFLAVGVLLLLFVPRFGARYRFKSLLLAQAGLCLALAPAGLYWFQQASFLGLGVNLLAIPWVSVFVVPPAILSTVLLSLEAGPGPFLLYLAAEGARWFEVALAAIEPLARHSAFVLAQPGVVLAVLGTAGATLYLLPRGMPQRIAGGLLMLPLLLPSRPGGGELQLQMLDVGQGLAVIAQTESGLLLYDSGPGDGRNWSLVPGVIAPAVAAAGRRSPDWVVISHRDLDHAGGLQDLQSLYPRATYLMNSRGKATGAETCTAGRQWNSSEATFTVLHPSPGLPYLGNDSSCVVSIETRGGRVLLPGDIGLAIEQRLLQGGLAPHDIVLAAHHGSRSSSGEAFIRGTHPRVALVSAGFGNRFGFPHDPVRRRFERNGSLLLSTAACGAIRVLLTGDGRLRLDTARRSKPAPWHWPAGENCP